MLPENGRKMWTVGELQSADIWAAGISVPEMWQIEDY
jgi:hypothetical protein